MAIALSERREYGPNDELIPFLHQVGARIIHEREGGLVECYVPMDAIDHEDVAVRQEWAQDLAGQMQAYAEVHGGTGQGQTIGLGMVPGEPKLKISDGFHRDAALRINRASEAYASARKTSWDELMDERIILAKDHTHVRFTRVVEWMHECWQHSGFPEEMTIVQALLLYGMRTSGRRLTEDPAVAKATAQWVAGKEAKWGIAAMTMREYLVIAENVDRALVHATRGKNRGDKLEAPTQAILKIFSEYIPKKFDLQNLVMNAAMAENLQGPQIRAVCKHIKNSSYKDAFKYVNSINWLEIENEYQETHARALRRARDPKYKGAAVLQASATEIRQVSERTNLITERGEDVTPEMVLRLEEARERAEQLMAQLGDLTLRLTEIIHGAPHNQEYEENVSSDREPTDDELEAIEGGEFSAIPTAEEQEPKKEGQSNGEVLEGAVVLILPEGTSQSIATLVSYLMGASDARPKEFDTADLHKAWGVVDSAPKKPKIWRSRFESLQKPLFQRAVVEERLMRDAQ
jgi:hypothetical protein